MKESYLYVITSSSTPKKTSAALASYGEVAALSDRGVWLLAVDADEADKVDLHAGSLLESLIDELGEDNALSVIEVDNIATYNIVPEGEQMLDQLYPSRDEEE